MNIPFYYLEKADFSNCDFSNFLKKSEEEKLNFSFIYQNSLDPYIYWDTFKHKFKDQKTGLSDEELWYYVKYVRNTNMRKTLIRTDMREHFRWFSIPSFEKSLHDIDMFAGGLIHSFLRGNEIDQKLIRHGILEEAIASSQLEGAHTTRLAAKMMILEKRPPKTKDEQMIYNNYLTMCSLDDEYQGLKLSEDLLLKMHVQLTKGTLPESEQNRMRTDEDKIYVAGMLGSEEFITHIPMAFGFLQDEIKRFISFANDEPDDLFADSYIHPVIKAILLHFWFGYLHPFTDGNGRLARAIFYWYLLRKGYRTIMYLPISTVIKKSPAQYAKAYIYTEQDDFDLTYFLDFNVQKIIQSIKETKEFLENKDKDENVLKEALENFNLNDRQYQLIHYLSSNKDARITVSSHSALHKITRQTAAKDLKSLGTIELLEQKRVGKYISYFATRKLFEKLS